jgi:nucleotidyltransferase substrate binding protein (TIGR01987 family)
MAQYTLDISPLTRAIAQLEQSLFYYHSDLVQSDPGLVLQLRAAAIQAFEFTYELSWKMLKRYLEMVEPDPQSIDAMSFLELIRTGSERGLLLSDVVQWKEYRYERSITSHTYNPEKSLLVFEGIPRFLKEAMYLHDQLQERCHGH